MKTFYRSILGVLLIGGFLAYITAYGLNHLQKESPLENIEKRITSQRKRECPY